MSRWFRLWKRRYRTRRSRVVRQPLLGSWNRARLLRALGVLVFFGVIGGTLVGGLLFAWYARDLPDPDRVVRREGFSTKIFDREGELLYDVFDDARRTPVKIEAVPERLKQATIAIEDQDFYEHGGYSPKGIVRSLLVNLLQGNRYGGSTLTQQLVKNALLTSEKKISRKIKEFVLAVQIERLFNKDGILQMYLNEAPYGGTAWGVVAGSETYFGKEVSELNLVESAILAGMPQRPSAYSPFGSNPDAYVGRTIHVLRRMREDGYISKDEENEAVKELDKVEFADRSSGIRAAHFVFYIIDQLEEMFGLRLVEQGGLRITTSLDLKLQEVAEEAVTEEVENVSSLNVGNGAALVMDAETGEILAMVGSKDFHAEDYDGQVNVTLAQRQPGSAIKPVTYATAFDKGYTPASMVMDTKTVFPGGLNNPEYEPENYDGEFRGPVQLRFALGSSLNVPAVKVLSWVGVADMLEMAYKMGFTTLEPSRENLDRFGLSVTLGGGEVRLIDMVSAYGAFANGGLRVEPVGLLKVEDKNGKSLFEHRRVKGKRVVDEKVAFLINHVLSDNNARLLTFGSNSLLNMGGRPVAVKTGTTNDRRDNWTVGWSSNVVVGAWVGNNDNSPMKGVASGVTGASPIWRRIILEVLGKRPAQAFEVPRGVEARFVDTVSGYPEHDGFPSRSEYVVAGTLPSGDDPIHTKLKLCHGQDKLATLGQIAGNNFHEKEFFVLEEDDPFSGGGENMWQKGIDEWLATQGDEKYHPPRDKCSEGEDGVVRINSPEHERDYGGSEIEVDMDVFADKSVEKLEILVDGSVKEKLEILVDGSVKETLTGKPYKTTISLSPGAYELQGRARLSGGDEVTSGVLKFGMGGISWDGSGGEPEPSPEP